MTARGAPAQPFDPAYYAPLFAIEDRHFWFRARNEVIARLVKELTAGLPAGYRVLEVGCGTGNALRVLAPACREGSVVGMDLFGEGLAYARQRTRAALVQADLNRPPFGARFDIMGLFDVLEHLPDDGLALRMARDLLASGGRLLITVPAHQWLWSYFDDVSHHCRRYGRADLVARLTAAGYRVERLTYFMASLLPLLWLGRQIGGLSARRGSDQQQAAGPLAAADLRVVPVLNEALAQLLSLEARLLARRHALPWGTSLLAVARRVPQT